jgi:hypothetical protein
MEIVVISGSTGAGKSTYTFMLANDAMFASQKAYKKYGKIRPCCSNLIFANHVEEFYGLHPTMRGYIFNDIQDDGSVLERKISEKHIREDGIIKYWQSPEELVKFKESDIVWDEIARHLDNTQWANMSLELKAWFQEHRKLGNDIIANTQDFDMVDKSVRRLCHVLYYNTKIIGSRDICANKPPVKNPWGLIIRKRIDPKTWDPEKIAQLGNISGFFFLTKRNVFGFDTKQRIRAGTYPPLHHIERSCERQNCKFHKILHA